MAEDERFDNFEGCPHSAPKQSDVERGRDQVNKFDAAVTQSLDNPEPFVLIDPENGEIPILTDEIAPNPEDNVDQGEVSVDVADDVLFMPSTNPHLRPQERRKPVEKMVNVGQNRSRQLTKDQVQSNTNQSRHLQKEH